MSEKVSRRKFLGLASISSVGLIMAACTTPTAAPAPTAQVIEKPVEVTRVVQVQGTPVVQVVTATPAPTKVPEKVADVLGTFPRR